MKTENQRQAILEIAEQLLREKGYNGWSYQDVSSAIGIRKASIHYYFPRKEDLGCALIEYYSQKSHAYLVAESCQLFNAKEKLWVFVRLYGQVLEERHSYCLCGMLAADLMTLPEKMQGVLKKSFKEQQNWVAQVLEEGSKQGVLKRVESFELEAALIMSCLQGMLLMARLEENSQEVFFTNATRFLLNIS